MTGQTDWLSAIGILLAGLVLGFMFIYAFVVRRREAPVAEDLELRDLEAKRDALLQQLRDLDAGDIDERARLELEAAQVLRKIDVLTGSSPSRDGLKPVATSEAPVPSGFFAKHPELKGFVWGVASIAALAFLWYFGFQSAKPKEEGGAAAAMQQAQTQQPSGAEDAAIKDLEARIQQSPDDLNLRRELTHLYLDKQNMMGVFDQTEYILKKQPNDAQAQTYQALVRMAMGQGDLALKLLNSATKNDPSLLDAWVTMAWYYTQTGDRKNARKAIDSAIERHPEQKARLTEVLQQMEAQVAGAPAQNAGPIEPGAPLPPGHPPVEGAAPAAMASASPSASAGSIVITVNLAGGKSVPQSAVLYIMARGEGVTAGPPVAVKRIAATAFPITIDLGAADSMMGQEIPAKVRLEARLDSDGNVMTKDATDLDAVQDGVALGSQVSLTLK